MAISVDRIHHQYHKENVVDFDFDVVEESKEFQKLSLTDNMPPKPQVPKSGKPLEQKPAGDFLYQNITKCLAPETFSPYLACLNIRPEPEWMRHEKPRSASTYSPSSPDWVHYVLPTYEEYVALKSAPIFIAPLISDK